MKSSRLVTKNCFDASASNIVINAATITIARRSFDRRQFFLACRHYVLEICAAAVFNTLYRRELRSICFGDSSRSVLLSTCPRLFLSKVMKLEQVI